MTAGPCYGWISEEGKMSNCEEKQKSKFKNVQKSFQHVLNISLLHENYFTSGAKWNFGNGIADGRNRNEGVIM